MSKAVILLSGGLDSLVALGYTKEKYGIELALTFDYGQKSAKQEIETSKKIAEFYNIKHKVIKLDWLKEITHTSLVSDDEIPTDNLGTKESASNVWVPNRNGLFLNIAASFADSFGYDYILFGANKDEGQTFPDNTEEFVLARRVYEFNRYLKAITKADTCAYKDMYTLGSFKQILTGVKYFHSPIYKKVERRWINGGPQANS